MSAPLEPQRTNLTEDAVAWLIGKSVVDVRFAAPESWWFHFTDVAYLAAHGGPWRIVGPSKLITSSADHAQDFGLGRPSDQAEQARLSLQGRLVRGVRIGSGAPDLVVSLDGELSLEFLAVSRGYECWESRDPAGRTVVVDGDRHASAYQGP